MIGDSLVAVGSAGPVPPCVPLPVVRVPAPASTLSPSVHALQVIAGSPLIRPYGETFLIGCGVGMGEATEKAGKATSCNRAALPRDSAWCRGNPES